MEIKSIKNVNQETWKKFKRLAERNNMKMSVLLKLMVNQYEKNSQDLWEEILSGRKSLNKSESEDINKIVGDLRKERGFRDEFAS